MKEQCHNLFPFSAACGICRTCNCQHRNATALACQEHYQCFLGSAFDRQGSRLMLLFPTNPAPSQAYAVHVSTSRRDTRNRAIAASTDLKMERKLEKDVWYEITSYYYYYIILPSFDFPIFPITSIFLVSPVLKGWDPNRFPRPTFAKGAVQYSTLDGAEGGYRRSLPISRARRAWPGQRWRMCR